MEDFDGVTTATQKGISRSAVACSDRALPCSCTTSDGSPARRIAPVPRLSGAVQWQRAERTPSHASALVVERPGARAADSTMSRYLGRLTWLVGAGRLRPRQAGAADRGWWRQMGFPAKRVSQAFWSRRRALLAVCLVSDLSRLVCNIESRRNDALWEHPAGRMRELSRSGNRVASSSAASEGRLSGPGYELLPVWLTTGPASARALHTTCLWRAWDYGTIPALNYAGINNNAPSPSTSAATSNSSLVAPPESPPLSSPPHLAVHRPSCL
jgi:hypothetical protein